MLLFAPGATQARLRQHGWMDGAHGSERTAEEVCEQAVMTRIRSGEEGGAGVALLCPFLVICVQPRTTV